MLPRNGTIVYPMQMLGAAFAILHLSTSLGSASELDQVCGMQPMVLEPIYPVEGSFKAPSLGREPEVIFTFEGQRPCASNLCTITIRRGGSFQPIATIRLVTDDVQYCRDRNLITKSDTSPKKGDPPDPCFRPNYNTFRTIDIAKKGREPARRFVVSWYQYATKGPTAFFCRGTPGAGDYHMSGDRFARVKVGRGALLHIYERSTLGPKEPSGEKRIEFNEAQ